jgi:hypothetical protein
LEDVVRRGRGDRVAASRAPRSTLRQVTIYRSTPHPLDDPRCVFTEVFTARPNGRGADSLYMLRGVDGYVYFVTFTSTGGKLPDEDWAELYVFYYPVNGFGFVDERQFYTNKRLNDVHFRRSAGLTIESGPGLQFYCTDRNLPREFNVNTFGE